MGVPKGTLFSTPFPMITLVCPSTTQGILFGLLFTRVNQSTCMNIVCEAPVDATTKQIDLHAFSQENILREYERKFATLSWFHEDTSLWDEIAHTIDDLLETNATQELILAAQVVLQEMISGNFAKARHLLRKVRHAGKSFLDLLVLFHRSEVECLHA